MSDVERVRRALIAHEPDRDDCDMAGLVCSNPAHLAHALAPLLAEVRAEALAEGERKARRNRHCGCAWCCSTVPPEKRGKAHQETCPPKPSAAALASGRAAVGEDSEGAGL